MVSCVILCFPLCSLMSWGFLDISTPTRSQVYSARLSGNLEGHFRRCLRVFRVVSGGGMSSIQKLHIKHMFEKKSRSSPGKGLEISGKCPGHFQDMSGTRQGNVGKTFGTFLETFREIIRETSWTFPGTFRDFFPDIFWMFSEHFRESAWNSITVKKNF